MPRRRPGRSLPPAGHPDGTLRGRAVRLCADAQHTEWTARAAPPKGARTTCSATASSRAWTPKMGASSRPECQLLSLSRRRSLLKAFPFI